MSSPSLRARLKRLLQGGLLAFVTMLLMALVLEVAVRWLAPQQLITFRRDIWQPADGVGWHHARHADTRINTGEREVRFRTDDHGHRIGGEDPAEDGWRVLALGDSFLEAVQVEYEDTTGAWLERGLASTLGPGRVINTGVGGWNPNHYLIELRHELTRQRLDAVVVFFFVGNDVVSATKEHFSPRPSAEPPGFHWPRAWNKRGLVAAFAYPFNNALETNSHLFVLAKNRLKFLLMRVGLSAHSFPPMLRTEYREYGGWDVSAGIVRTIVDTAARQGVPTIVALLPGVYQVDDAIRLRYQAALGIDPATVDADQPSRQLLPRLVAQHIQVIDTLPALRAAHRDGQGPLYGTVDTHLAPEGHRVVAAAVGPVLENVLRTALSARAADVPDTATTDDESAAP